MSERQAPDPMRQGPADSSTSKPDDALRQGPDFTFGAPQPPTGGNPGRERPTPWAGQPHQQQGPQQPQAQPYHEQSPQPGQRYGQTPGPGMQAYHPLPAEGNRRPAIATAAAVLSIIDGILGGLFTAAGNWALIRDFAVSDTPVNKPLGLLKAGIMIFTLTALIQFSADAGLRGRSDLSLANPATWTSYGESFITLCIALTLIAAGVRFFKGRGHTALAAASIAQFILTLCELWFTIAQTRASQYTPPIVAVVIIILVIGMALAAVSIAFLFNRSSMMWKKTAGRQTRP